MSEKFHNRSNQLGENKKSRIDKSMNFNVFVVSDFEISDVDFRKSSSANSKVWNRDSNDKQKIMQIGPISSENEHLEDNNWP